MWNINSLWFEVAIVSTLTAVGGMVLGHFEEQTPKWRKISKLLFFILVVTSISATLGRIWAFTFLGIMILFVLYIHVIWLPRKGINGWTGEPKDKYYELRGWKKKDRPAVVPKSNLRRKK
jgi:ABC-type sugar transport system permease subunit